MVSLTKSLFYLLTLSGTNTHTNTHTHTHTHTHTVIKQVRDKLRREITDQSVLKAWQQGTVCLISATLKQSSAINSWAVLSLSWLLRALALSLWLSHSPSLSQSPSSIVSISFVWPLICTHISSLPTYSLFPPLQFDPQSSSLLFSLHPSVSLSLSLPLSLSNHHLL